MNPGSPRARFLAAGTLALGAAPAGAAIVVFDISPDKTILPVAALAPNQVSGLHLLSIGLATGTYSQFTSSNFQELYYGFFGSTFTIASGRNPYEFSFVGANTSGAGRIRIDSLLSGGDLVNVPSANWSSNSYAAVNFPTGTFYFGLRLENGSNVNYGWLEMTDDPVAGKLVTRFAFNDLAGGSILAGQTSVVPEASTFGLVGGLFGLAAAAHMRRRKAKQATASDKFLALAAGEKLN